MAKYAKQQGRNGSGGTKWNRCANTVVNVRRESFRLQSWRFDRLRRWKDLAFPIVMVMHDIQKIPARRLLVVHQTVRKGGSGGADRVCTVEAHKRSATFSSGPPRDGDVKGHG